MSNDLYLRLSYVGAGLAALVLAWTAYFALKKSLAGATGALAESRLRQVIRRLFFPGVVLPAMVGFLSVTFHSCSKNTYQKIIEDRAYLIAKNQEQISASLSHVVIALMVWGLILLGVLALSRRSRAHGESPVSRVDER
jgi:hypothetical protein